MILSILIHGALAASLSLGAYRATDSVGVLIVVGSSLCAFGYLWEFVLQRVLAKQIKALWLRGVWPWKLWDPQASKAEAFAWSAGVLLAYVVAILLIGGD